MTDQAPVVWLTGLSSAGKTTIAELVMAQLARAGKPAQWLDGDEIRRRLWSELGFSAEARRENIRRMAFMAGLLVRRGVFVVVSAITPYRDMRAELRREIPGYLEVFVKAPLGVCEARDVKGLYRRARTGEICGMTGVDDPYEAPAAAEVECRTDRETPEESAAKVLAAVWDYAGRQAR
ncbi:MAG: adenylyl-sulfate kinase [Terriglobales bacterium]